MDKQEIISRLEEILQKDLDSESDSDWFQEVRELTDQFEKIRSGERQKSREQFLADGGDPKEFVFAEDPLENRSKELFNTFKEKKKLQEEKRQAAETANLETKNRIIKDIRELTETEENIGRSFQRFRELQQEWKETGAVSNQKYKELQHEYSQIIEEFFYNIRIYKELQEHDLRRNLALKKAMVIQMQELQKEESIKKAESLLKVYLNDWDEIGPTYREQWEEVRDEFRKATSEVYGKIKVHYTSIKDQQKENLQAKTELCEKVEALLVSFPTRHKDWQKVTETILGFQKEWKGIGFATKKKNEAIWTRFRTACDVFFEKKKEYYAEQKKGFQQNRDRKQELINKAEAIKDSTDWKASTEALIQLQSRWKSIGPASPRDEHRLWKAFREACDHFFAAKKTFYSTMDERQAGNLAAKEAHLKKAQEHKLSGDKDQDLVDIHDLAMEWKRIGNVPSGDRDRLSKGFNQALDKLYDQLSLSEKQKSLLQFRHKVEGFQESSRPDKLWDREEGFLQDKVRKLKETIQQYENNLGFFSASKGAESLKKEVEDKINRSKDQLDHFREKLDLLYEIREEAEN